jgi:hypothetical protein
MDICLKVRESCSKVWEVVLKWFKSMGKLFKSMGKWLKSIGSLFKNMGRTRYKIQFTSFGQNAKNQNFERVKVNHFLYFYVSNMYYVDYSL